MFLFSQMIFSFPMLFLFGVNPYRKPKPETPDTASREPD